MEPRVHKHEANAEVSQIDPTLPRKEMNEVVMSLADRIIAFVDARMHIVEERPAPQPMRKAG